MLLSRCLLSRSRSSMDDWMTRICSSMALYTSYLLLSACIAMSFSINNRFLVISFCICLCSVEFRRLVFRLFKSRNNSSIWKLSSACFLNTLSYSAFLLSRRDIPFCAVTIVTTPPVVVTISAIANTKVNRSFAFKRAFLFSASILAMI